MRHPLTTAATLLAAALGAARTANADIPQQPAFIVHTPDTTGMPGQSNVTFARFDPQGRVWMSSRNIPIWPFGGIGILDGEIWTTYSNRNSPVPQWTYQVAWDSAGDAWVAGEERVVRFDGAEWTVYDASNSPLAGDRNWDVAVDADGHVWVANDDIDQVQGGLFEFDGSQWLQHDEPWMQTYFGAAVPFGVFARSNGEVWAAFQFMSGMARHDGQGWAHQGGPQILEFAEAPDGTLYGVNGLGTYRFDDKNDVWITIGPYTSFVCTTDDQGVLWVGDDDFVRRYDGSWSTFAVGPSDVASIEVRPDGHVWVAFEHSVRHYGPGGEGIALYTSITTGVPDYNPDRVDLDAEGNLWISTGMAGTTRFDGAHEYRNFGPFGHNEAWPFGEWTTGVKQVFHDSAGVIWFTGNAVARSLDLVDWEVWTPANSPLTAGVDHIGEAGDGTIWIGTDYATFWLDEDEWSEVQLGDGGFNQIRRMVTDAAGVLWLLAQDGLYRNDGGTWVNVPGVVGGRDLAVAPGGDLWVATGSGLRRYNGVTWTTYTPANSGLAELNVSAVAVREDGLVAAASEDLVNWPYDGGLAFFDGQEWTAFDYGESDLPFYQSRSIEFDDDGNLWMAMINYGVVKVEIEPAPLAGDVNGDGVVNVSDLTAVILAWGGCPPDCPADLDGDGVVGVGDLLAVILNWTA